MHLALTCSGTRWIKRADGHAAAIHPSVDFRIVYYVATYFECKWLLINFDQLSRLSSVDNVLHFLGLDVSVELPLADT